MFFYLVLYFVDFIELFYKKKVLFKLFYHITNVFFFIWRCLKGAVLFFLNILYFIHFYDFYPESNSFDTTVQAGNQKTKLGVRKRAVSFNEKITIIPIDENESGSENNKLNEIDEARIKKNSINEYSKNKQSKNYMPVETFPTLQHGIQRLKENPVGNQHYIYK